MVSGPPAQCIDALRRGRLSTQWPLLQPFEPTVSSWHIARELVLSASQYIGFISCESITVCTSSQCHDNVSTTSTSSKTQPPPGALQAHGAHVAPARTDSMAPAGGLFFCVLLHVSSGHVRLAREDQNLVDIFFRHPRWSSCIAARRPPVIKALSSLGACRALSGLGAR